MKSGRVPESFIKLAGTNGIPASYACDLFVRFSHKKGQQDLVIQMAQDLGLTETEVRKKFSELRKDHRKLTTGLSYTEDQTDYMQRAYTEFQRLIGKTREVKKPKLTKYRTTNLFISDTHWPFANPNVLKRVFEEEADIVWVLGDIVDFYSLARYRSTIDHIQSRDEIAQGRNFMEELSMKFKQVNVIPGNHDNRGLKKIQEFMPSMLPLIVPPVKLMCEGLSNVNIMSFQVPETAPSTMFGEDVELDFMAVDGDLLIGHFENFYGKDAAQNLSKWLSDWDHILKIDKPRLILQAHTHRLSLNYSPKGQALVQTGCLCNPQPYQFENHGKFCPPTNGFVKVEREGGETLLDTLRLIQC